MGILEFMSDSPVLTFFLVIIIGEIIIECTKALRKK